MSMARKTQNLLNNISFQNEAMCKSFFVKNYEFYLHENKVSIFIPINFAFSFALKQGLEETQKWPNFRHV